MARDVRVILVKLADRLHNMRTISNPAPEKRERIARETMEIYAPLAGRMGMQTMREQLEDLAFEVLNPEARTSILRRFVKLRRETGDLIPEISAEIRGFTDEAGLDVRIEGREKRPYSVWRKMEEKQTGFSQLSDIYAFRIICRQRATTATGRSARCTGTGARCRGGSRTTSRAPRRTAIARCTRPSIRLGDAHRDPDPHRGDARGRRDAASPRTGPTRTACASRTALPSIPTSGCATWWRGWRRATSRRSSSSTSSWTCSTTRSSASRRRATWSACRAARRRSISPTRSTPRSATTAPALWSTDAGCRSGRGCGTASRSRSSPPRGQSPIAALGGHRPDRARQGTRSGGRCASRMRNEQVALGRDLAEQGFARAGREAGDKTFAVGGRAADLCLGR